MSDLEVFGAVDDFLLSFQPQWKASQRARWKQRKRVCQLCDSEVMTMRNHVQRSPYRTCKAYSTEYVQVCLSSEFPCLVS